MKPLAFPSCVFVLWSASRGCDLKDCCVSMANEADGHGLQNGGAETVGGDIWNLSLWCFLRGHNSTIFSIGCRDVWVDDATSA